MFKFKRVAAIGYILREFQEDPNASRIMPASLMLGAACIYMLNAVMSRPGDWRAERALRDVCCLHLPDDVPLRNVDRGVVDFDPDAVHPSAEEQGLYFLAGLLRDARHGWWRFPRSRRLEMPQLCILYHAGTLGDIEARFGTTALSRSRKPNMNRMNNRRSQTIGIKYINPDAIQPSVFGLDDLGIRLQPQLQYSGLDDDALSDEEDPDDLDHVGDRDEHGELLPDAILDLIWPQVAFDIMQVSPNKKSRQEPAYTTLNPEQRNTVTMDMFQHLTIPLSSMWVRRRDKHYWMKTQFDRFFPPKGNHSLLR